MERYAIVCASLSIIIVCMAIEWEQDKRRFADTEKELAYLRGYTNGKCAAENLMQAAGGGD